MTDEKSEQLLQKLAESFHRINEHRMHYNEITISPMMLEKFKINAAKQYEIDSDGKLKQIEGLKIISNDMVPDNSIIIGFNGKIVDIIRVDR